MQSSAVFPRPKPHPFKDAVEVLQEFGIQIASGLSLYALAEWLKSRNTRRRNVVIRPEPARAVAVGFPVKLGVTFSATVIRNGKVVEPQES